MFISQILLFIVVLSVFAMFEPAAPAYTWPQALAVEAGQLLGLFLLLKLLSKWLFSKGATIKQVAALSFKGQLLSLALLLCFCTLFDFKALLYQYQIARNWEIISAVLLSMLFFLHLIVVWLALYPQERRISANGVAVVGRLLLIVPMVFPWLLLALTRDLLSSLWNGGKDFLNSNAGYFTLLGFLVIIMVAALPPLMKAWWRCKPVAEPAHERIKQVLAVCRVKVNAICDWPVLGASALSAAIMGVVPGLRYLLITPKLIEVLDGSELEAVVAHEAGHVRHGHLLLYLLLFLSYVAAIYCLSEPLHVLINFIMYVMASSNWGAELLLKSYASQGWWTLLAALPMLALLVVYLRFVLGFFMRHMERQADFFALDFMGSAQPLASALEVLAALSGNSREQPSWHHFSIAQRTEALYQAPAGQAAARQGRYLRRAALLLCAAMLLAFGLNMAVQKSGVSESLHQATVEKLRQNPHNLMGQYLLAHQRWRSGHEEEAIKILQAVLREEPFNPNVLNDLAWFLLRVQNDDYYNPVQALSMAKLATEINSDSAAIWDTLAEAYLANQDYAGALASSQIALQKVKDDNISYYQDRLKFFEKLMEYYQKEQSGEHAND